MTPSQTCCLHWGGAGTWPPWSGHWWPDQPLGTSTQERPSIHWPETYNFWCLAQKHEPGHQIQSLRNANQETQDIPVSVDIWSWNGHSGGITCRCRWKRGQMLWHSGSQLLYWVTGSNFTWNPPYHWTFQIGFIRLSRVWCVWVFLITKRNVSITLKCVLFFFFTWNCWNRFRIPGAHADHTKARWKKKRTHLRLCLF